jgi:SAM-dependent methyltransferase
MDWRAKAIVQNILSSLPAGERLNNFLQVRTGGLRNFDNQVRTKINDWLGTMQLLADCGVRVSDAATMEIGTGWFPTLPLCFWLAGAQSCFTYDLCRHLRPELTRRLVIALEVHLDAIAASAGLPLAIVRERYVKLQNDILAASGITYVAPGDASHTGLPDQSVDIVFSNSVLEHVSPESLPAIMRETRRILRPSGVAVHCVACNDHYAHFDSKISYINYLRFSAQEWRRWNNSLQFQNRLRAPDFLRLTEDAGFRLMTVQQCVRPGVEQALETLPIAPEFHTYSRSELAATTVNFVCQASN